MCMCNFIYRAETYGPVYKMNVLHHILVVTTCPEATKVNTPTYYSISVAISC